MNNYKSLFWRIPMGLGVLVLIGVSAVGNYQYGQSFGGPIFGAASVASDLIKIVALIGVVALWQMRHRIAAIAAAACFAGFTAWSMLSAVGFVSTHFATMTDDRGKTAADWQNLTSQIERLEKRRAKVEPARPAATIQAEIDRLLLTPQAEGCTTINGPVTRAICPKVAELRAELGHAKDADWLDGRLNELRQEQKSAKMISVVDPRTDAIVALTGLAAGAVALFIKLLFAGLVEFATAVGLYIVTRPTPLRATQEPQEQQREKSDEPDPESEKPAPGRGQERPATRKLELAVNNTQPEFAFSPTRESAYRDWLNRCTQSCATGGTPTQDIYASYVRYAKDVGTDVYSRNSFGIQMKNAGYGRQKRQINGTQVRVYPIRLKGGGLVQAAAA